MELRSAYRSLEIGPGISVTTSGPSGCPATNVCWNRFAAIRGRLPVPVKRFARKQGRTRDAIVMESNRLRVWIKSENKVWIKS